MRRLGRGVTRMPEVFVEMLGEAVDVWRPVEAAHVDQDWYQITSAKPDPTEEWAFETGDVVRCEWQQRSGGWVLVAVERRRH